MNFQQNNKYIKIINFIYSIFFSPSSLPISEIILSLFSQAFISHSISTSTQIHAALATQTTQLYPYYSQHLLLKKQPQFQKHTSSQFSSLSRSSAHRRFSPTNRSYYLQPPSQCWAERDFSVIQPKPAFPQRKFCQLHRRLEWLSQHLDNKFLLLICISLDQQCPKAASSNIYQANTKNFFKKKQLPWWLTL